MSAALLLPLVILAWLAVAIAAGVIVLTLVEVVLAWLGY